MGPKISPVNDASKTPQVSAWKVQLWPVRGCIESHTDFARVKHAQIRSIGSSVGKPDFTRLTIIWDIHLIEKVSYLIPHGHKNILDFYSTNFIKSWIKGHFSLWDTKWKWFYFFWFLMLSATVQTLSVVKIVWNGVELHRNGSLVVGENTDHTVQIQTMIRMEIGAIYQIQHMAKAGIIAQNGVRRTHQHHGRR